MKQGFSLIEMLVVIGIIAVLLGASVGAYTGITRSAERKRCQELVDNTATALTALFQDVGSWPRALRSHGATDGLLDSNSSFPLAKYMTITVHNGKLAGYDRFGIVTPWAMAHIRSHGNAASLTDKIGAGTIQDHILHYAVDLDGDGIIEGASVGGESVNIRATAAVWSCGKDGKLEPYSRGLKSDDVYSWSYGQTRGVK